MLGRVSAWWRGYRERSRQHAIDRALYKAGGGRGARDGGAPGTTGGSQVHQERSGGYVDAGGAGGDAP
jgi:hypothetical protein